MGRFITVSFLPVRRTYRPRVIKPTAPAYRVNRQITVPEVRLIDENDDNIGVIATAEAITKAEQAGLDLVEVSPLAKPPVAKIIDFSQFKYQRDKEVQKAKAKQKKQEIKGVRLSTRIGTHDRALRLLQAGKFLDEGHKLKVELQLKGREHQHKDLAAEVIEQFLVELRKRYKITVEQPLQKQGGRLSLVCYSGGKIEEPKAEEEV